MNKLIGEKYTLCAPFRESLKSTVINNPEYNLEEKINNILSRLSKNKQYIIRTNSPNKIETKSYGVFESHIVYPNKEEIAYILKKESKKIREQNCLPQFLLQEYIHFDISGVASSYYKDKIDCFHIEYGKNDEVTSGQSHKKYIYNNKHKPIKELKKVDKLIRKVKNKFNKDIIIEWGIKNNKIFLLQVRIIEKEDKNVIDRYIQESSFYNKKNIKKSIFCENQNYPVFLDIDLINYASSGQLLMKKNGFYEKNISVNNLSENEILFNFISLEENVKLKGKTKFLPHYLKKEIKQLKSIYDIKRTIDKEKLSKTLIDELYQYSTALYFMNNNRIDNKKSSIVSPSNNNFSITSPRFEEHEWPEKPEEFFDLIEYKTILNNKLQTIKEELNFLEISTISKIRKILKKKPYPISYRASLSLSCEEILNDNIPRENILLSREQRLRKIFNEEGNDDTYYVYGNIQGKVINTDDFKEKNIPIVLNNSVVIVGKYIPNNIIVDYDKIEGIITNEDTGELSHIVLNAKIHNIPVLISEHTNKYKTGDVVNIKY